MKYRIAVQKQREEKEEDMTIFRGRLGDEGFDNVFTAEIGADEAIGLVHLLWDISKRK
jgi:hypothetical protein